LIAGLIAAGRIFSAISLNGIGAGTTGLDSIIHGMIGFTAYFGPYFLIPLTFTMSGAMMGGIGNFINQRGQGVQGLIGGYRSNAAKDRIARARTKGLYREGFGKYKLRPGGKQRSIGHGLNTLGFWTVNPDEMVPMKLGTTKAGKLLPGGKEGIPGFRRGGHALESQIKRANRDQTVKAVQDLDIGYKSGRLMGGQFGYYYKALADPKNPDKVTAAQKELNDKFAMRDSVGRVMYGEDGKTPVGWNAPTNWGERNKVADIFSTAQGSGGIEAREAAGELRGVASEFEKYTGSAETNRVDGRLLGMVSAAKAGRLQLDDVAANHNRLLADGDQESAIRETTLLQDALTGKRVSAARGHGLAYRGADEAISAEGKKKGWKAGQAYSVYEDPASAKAQSSLMRINTQEIAGSKSEDVDTLRETIVAGASVYKMRFDPKAGKDGKGAVVPIIDKTTGEKVLKDPESTEGQRVNEVRGRLKQIALYNYGDSDIGVKVRDIWVNRLGLPEDELEWGGGRGATAVDAELAGHTGGPGDPATPPPGAEG